MKGSYILIIENTKNQNIQIGKLGNIFFKKGFYAYIGSGQNSLEGRLNRHKKSDKKKHWHIDYLIDKTQLIDIYIKEGEKRQECEIASYFKEKLEEIPSFGCSDCKCSSHLFYKEKENYEGDIKELDMYKYLI